MTTLRSIPLLALLTGLTSGAAAQTARESLALPNNGPDPLPLGTTRGERYGRLVIRGVTAIGRGTPGSNRGVAWTIKDGILFDAQAQLREVEWYVEREKDRLKGKPTTDQGR